MAMNAYRTKLNTLKANAKKAKADADAAEAEYEAINSKCEEIERTNLSLLDEIERIEEEGDSVESSLSSNKVMLSDARKKFEEDRQIKATLDVRVNHDDKRINRLENERDQDTAKLEEVSADLEKREAEILESEAELAEQENRAEDLTTRVKELEVRVTEVCNDLRTKQITDTQTSTRTMASDKKIEELEALHLKSVQETEEHETKIAELEDVLSELDQELEEIKATHKEKHEELRMAQAMIQDM